MLLYRRVLVIPLLLLLFVALFSALLFCRLETTLLEPEFHKQQLRDAQFYDFLLTGFLDAAIEEVVGGSPEDGGLLAELGVEEERLSRTVTTAISRAWLQEQVESSIDEIVPYVAGESDEFEVNVDIKEQAGILLAESKTLQRESRSYELVMTTFVDPILDDLEDEESIFGVRVAKDRLRDITYRVFTEEWVHHQIDLAIDDMTPYVIGDEESFRVTVPLNDRARLALAEFTRMLSETNGYDALYDEVVQAQVLNAVGESVELFGGIVLTDDEIVAVLNRVVPVEWVEAQAETIVADGSGYLVGDDNDFSTTIYFVDRKQLALQIVVDLASRKVMQQIESLPVCARPISTDYVETVRSGRIPDCIPRNVNVEALREPVNERVSRIVTPLILELIPDEVTFTEQDMRNTVVEVSGDDGLQQFDELRNFFSEGLTFTDEDLTGQTSDSVTNADTAAFIEDTRAFIANGWNFDQSDLKVTLARSELLDPFDGARSFFSLLPALSWVLFPASVGLGVGIGFLGGTSWRARVLWGAGALAGVSVLILVIWSLLYWMLLRPQLIGVLDSFGADGTSEGVAYVQGLLAGKIAEVLASELDVFSIGVIYASVIPLVIGIIGLLAWYFWNPLSAVCEPLFQRVRQIPMRFRDSTFDKTL